MALRSRLFQDDAKLAAAAVSDPAHIVPGSSGPHVAKVQRALQILDGANIAPTEVAAARYGTTTANAVLGYKQKRDIINRSRQTKADNIVGKMTMVRLDEEMASHERAHSESQYICADHYGCADHSHAGCRRHSKSGLASEIEVSPDGTMSHFGTPRNPLRSGRMVTIGGAWEAEYLGFENFVPDPLQDPSMPMSMVNGRPFTHTLRPQSVSDISFRSAPLDRFMRWEILRISMPGARLTFVSNERNVQNLMGYFSSIGRVIESGTITEPPKPVANSVSTASTRRYAVTTVLHINPWLDPKFLSHL